MKKLFKLTLAVIAMVLFTSAQTMAQRTVSGTITDSAGEALIGANVLEKGTTNGTITDLDGSYSLTVATGATLVFSFTGYTDQEVVVGNSGVINIALDEGELLDEIVVTGYGSQRSKEVTSAVESISEEEFNKGPINDPAQLLQGKVAGLQVYNRGGDPNASSTIRLRGISTVGANVQPLVVIDGIVGASLDNVDPNDIAEISVLKDGSAAAIYGSRGSSGVILVTTKSGSDGAVKISYNGQLTTSSPVNGVQSMSASEFVAAGGTDLANSTNWLDEVTRSGMTQIHNISASGGAGNTNYRISANLRGVDGILKNSGFDQFNTRLAFNTKTLNDKLKIAFTTSFTNRDQQFGFQEALRYAVTYNPSAPIFGADAPFDFNSARFGGYFESGGFDNFNPVSIIEQNINNGERREFNYGATLDYSLTDNLTITGRIAQQNVSLNTVQYYPTTSLFRGNATSPIRKGSASLYDQQNSFDLYEAYGTYLGSTDAIDFTLTAGYSFQENNFFDNFLSLGDFPNNGTDFYNLIETSQDLSLVSNAGLIGAGSNATENDRIIAFFARANVTIGNGIFLNASVRREGATRLGPDNKWGIFPAFGVGVDLNQYLDIASVDLFKVRLGYGETGSLPGQVGLAQDLRAIVNSPDGTVTTQPSRLGNPNLGWESKKETNLGVEFASGRFSSTLDLYNRVISDFILNIGIDAAVNGGFSSQIQNAGQLSTNGLELALNYDVADSPDFGWTTGVILSSYKSTLDEFNIEAPTLRANLGAPGQNATDVVRVAIGEEIGNIWGPVFAGVDADGAIMFEDVNGDGTLKTDQGQALEDDADFAVLGNGIPDLELGWTNQITVGDWQINAFFRGAFGHSLVNTFRAFYEPRIASQSNYNYVNTSLSNPDVTSARFSSLYVEKADFFKLDNLTVSRSFDVSGSSAFESVALSLNVRNPFVITSYTGTDPEPSLVDTGASANGDGGGGSDVLAPGLDRRNNYFSSRAITFGVNVNF